MNTGSYSWPALDAVTSSAGTGTTALVLGGMSQASTACDSSAPCPQVQVVTLPWAGSTATIADAVHSDADVSNNLPSGKAWWHVKDFTGSDQGAVGGELSAASRLGHYQWVSSMVKILPGSTPTAMTLLLSGRGGVWRGQYTTAPARSWSPAVDGLQSTFSLGVAQGVTSSTVNQAFSIDTDWQVLRSADAFATLPPHNHQPYPGTPVPDPGAVALDSNQDAYVGYADGTIMYNPTPFSTGSSDCWTAIRNADTHPVMSIAAGPDISTGKTRLTVMLQGEATTDGTHTGIQTTVFTPPSTCAGLGTISWTDMPIQDPTLQVGGTSYLPSYPHGSLVYDTTTNSKALYVFDQSANLGVFRALQTGNTFGAFTQIYIPGSNNAVDATSGLAGWIVLDPKVPGTLYFDFNKTAYQITNAKTANRTTTALTFPTTPPNSFMGSQKKFASLAVGGDQELVLANGVSDAAGTTSTVYLFKANAVGGTALVAIAPLDYPARGFRPSQMSAAASVASSSPILAAFAGSGLITINP